MTTVRDIVQKHLQRIDADGLCCDGHWWCCSAPYPRHDPECEFYAGEPWRCECGTDNDANATVCEACGSEKQEAGKP